MFRIFSRGREIPLEHHQPRASGAASLHEAKLAAWAIAIGENRPSADPPHRLRRHNRGMHDDLPSPERPYRRPRPSSRAIIEMVGRAFGFGAHPPAEAALLSGSSISPVGESPEVTYIDRSEARESSSQAPAGAVPELLQSRAA
jgi:hypothetical protein